MGRPHGTPLSWRQGGINSSHGTQGINRTAHIKLAFIKHVVFDTVPPESFTKYSKFSLNVVSKFCKAAAASRAVLRVARCWTALTPCLRGSHQLC